MRASGRPVIVVANKSEGRAGEEGFYAAFELGFGEPVAISAEHGEGLSRSRDRDAGGARPDSRSHGSAATATSGARGTGTARPIRVAIVGRPNAGKSTLVNAFLGEERMITGPEPGLTRDSVPSDLEWSGRKVRLFDTAGLRRKAKITETAEKLSASDAIRAIRFAEVVVLLIDAERPFEHQDLTIGDLVTEEGRALVIAINKWDLVEDKQKMLKELRETLGYRLAQVPGVALVPLSALSGRGHREAIDGGARSLRHVEPPRLDSRPQPLARRKRWGATRPLPSAAVASRSATSRSHRRARRRSSPSARARRICRNRTSAISPTACATPSSCPACRCGSTCARAGWQSAGQQFSPSFMCHMYDYGTTPEQVAAVRVAHSGHASNNPKAFYKKRVTVADVINSRIICKPLHLLDCCVETDNATAIVITRADRARDGRHPSVLVRGVAGRVCKPRADMHDEHGPIRASWATTAARS